MTMGAQGGGACSMTSIVKDLYGNKAVYHDLKLSKKTEVATTQQHQWWWINDFTAGVIYSTDCHKDITSNACPPCETC